MRHKIPTVCPEGQIELTLRVDRKTVEILNAIAYGMPHISTVEEYATEVLQEQFPRSMWQTLQADKKFYKALAETRKKRADIVAKHGILGKQ